MITENSIKEKIGSDCLNVGESGSNKMYINTLSVTTEYNLENISFIYA